MLTPARQAQGSPSVPLGYDMYIYLYVYVPDSFRVYLAMLFIL